MNTIQKSQLLFPDLFQPSARVSKPSPKRRKRVFGTPKRPGNAMVFVVSLLAYLLGIFPSMLYALPAGGTVQAGSATLSQPSANALIIQQSTDKAIIDWRSFGILGNERVDFQLPSSNGVTLNRVTGNEPSGIFGKLTSNGNLMLINPNGILFGAGSQIDVHGLVATTSDIRNEDFLIGNYNFDIPSNRGGIVANRGTITAAEGGLVALVAPGVQNDGIITARLGRVNLASGNTFTLDLYGDQLVNLGVGSQIVEQVTGLDGEVLTSLVSNRGKIFADGGMVRLNVNAARDVVDQVVNMSGIVQARTVEDRNGTIILRGGEAGQVDVSGTLDASGLDAGETGGTIHVFGDRIGLFGSALLDVSGDIGGGAVLVGGGYQGLGAFPTADETFVDRNVSIFADAISSGHGGRSIFWANRRMRFFGSVYARGGRERGDGGFIEVSGKEELFFDGFADTSAPNGLMGTLLLDPEDIVIADGSGATSGAVTFTIFEQTLEAQKSNINLQANNSITLQNLSDNLLFNISGSVTMMAGIGGITFLDANDKIKGIGDVSLTATGGNLNLGSIESTEGNITLQGKNVNLAGTLTSFMGAATLTASQAITLNGNLSSAGNASLNAGTGITLANGISVSSGGTLTLSGGAGNIGSTGAANLTSNQGITLSSSFSSTGNANLNAGTGITLASGISVSSGGTLTLTSTTGVNAQGAVTVSSANGLTLNDNFTSAGATAFDADSNNDGSGSFTVAVGKTVSTGNNSLSITGADIALAGSLNSGTGTTTLLSSNGGTIGLGATAGSLTIDGSELQNITAANLIVGDGTNGSITVNGITAGNSNNIAGTTTLNATRSGSTVTFSGAASTFNALTVNAGNGVAVNAGLTTDTGNLALSGGAGSITGTGTTNLTSNQGITLSSSFSSTGDANINAGTDITLANGISVSSGGTLTLTSTTGVNAQGAVTVSSANGLTLNDKFTSAGATAFDADSDDDGTGSFTVAVGKTVATGNNSLSITGADIALAGSLNSGTGTTTLLVSKADTAIGLGAGAKAFQLSNSELDNITAGKLVIGDNTNGDITVDGATVGNNIAGTTTLNATKSTSNVAVSGTASTFNALTVNAGSDVTVNAGLITDTGGLTLSGGGTVTDAGGGQLTVAGASNITGTTAISLTNTANLFTGAVSLNTGGNVALLSNNALTLGASTIGGNFIVTVAGGNGLIVAGNQTAGGTIFFTVDQNMTLTGGLFSSNASAGAIKLTAGGGIFDGDLTGALDISAPSGGLVVNSVTGFGTSGNAIETRVASVDINNTGAGDVNIFETDSLNIVNINHSDTGDIKVSFFGTLSGKTNAIAANGIITFISRDLGSLFLPEFGKTLSELSTERTVSLTRNLKSNYSFGNQPSITGSKTVTQLLSGPSSGPFVTNVFDESFELIQVAKGSRRVHKGLRGFANFWGPTGTNNTEMVKRPSRKSVSEEAKLRKKSGEKRKRLERKRRSKFKNARLKRMGDTAAVTKTRQRKKTGNWFYQILDQRDAGPSANVR